jgi:hypothetical protein
MRLVVRVPKDRNVLISDLERRATETGRSKEQIVLDALEAYLLNDWSQAANRPYLRTVDLGAPSRLGRARIYDDVIDRRSLPM